MTTYVEIHAIQTVPPSNINRDDTGAPKTATYGGVTRARVSSQSWKRAIREDFNERLDPRDIGMRSRMIVSAIAKIIEDERPDLADSADDLGVAAMEAAGFKKPAPKKRGKSDVEEYETGYLVFMSQRQIEALAKAAITASEESNPLKAMRDAKVKDLVDAEHSVDIALFGRMIADSADLNVDAACQVAHALSVHEATPEFDFFTAVDDAKSRDEDEEDAGAGMMGTVGFVSSTFYRYAAINVDQLLENLGSEDAARQALQAFIRSFVEAMPTGKINTFAHGTRPSALLVTVAEGQPTSFVGAFEDPIRPEAGYVKPAVAALAQYAKEVFETWRTPRSVGITGLPSDVGSLSELGEVGDINSLIGRTVDTALERA